MLETNLECHMEQNKPAVKVISEGRAKKAILDCSSVKLPMQSIRSNLSLDNQLRVNRDELYKMLTEKFSLLLNAEDFYSCKTVGELLALISKTPNNLTPQKSERTKSLSNKTHLDELLHSIKDAEDDSNSFMAYRSRIISALNKYQEAIKECNIQSDYGQSYSITKKARRFIDGHFTLAVVGKMSSGKSTFINALIGNNILPTGFFQTTCALIEIINSEEEFVEIQYFAADGRIVTKKYNANISETLKSTVAVPEMYGGGFPVNTINRYIRDGYDEKSILTVKDNLERISNRKLDDNSLIEYVKSHPIDVIPQKVTVHTKLPSELHGWRIVDTPGVEAVGGIENETREFLREKDPDGNSNVDAIIFVHKATENSEDLSFSKFVKDTCDSLPETVRDRLFLVITKSTDKEFFRNKDTYIKNLKSCFEFANCPIDRVFHVDSLLELLRAHVANSSKKVEYKSINVDDNYIGWPEKVWEGAIDLLDQISTAILKKPELTDNNATYEQFIDRCSEFKKLYEALNSFIIQTRESEYNAIISLIKGDLCSFRDKINNEINELEEKKINPKAQEERLQNELKSLYDSIESKEKELQNLNEDTFKPRAISERLKISAENYEKIRQQTDKSSIDKIINDLIDDIKNRRSEIYKEIKFQADEIVKDNFNIDTEKLLDEARKESQDRNKPIYESNGIFAKVMRFISGRKLFSSIKGYEVDEGKMLIRYAEKSISEFTELQKKMKVEINDTIRSFKENLKSSLDDSKSRQQKEKNTMLENSATLNDIVESIDIRKKRRNKLEPIINSLDYAE